MAPIVISISPARVHYTPLRRVLAVPPPRADHWRTALLVAAAVAVFVDVELGLAYVLHFAARLLG
ncbi:MAG TPA: hypothetical protein VGI14_13955 [Casimicrobiaceae bacterium]|jgi:hypothetical protein